MKVLRPLRGTADSGGPGGGPGRPVVPASRAAGNRNTAANSVIAAVTRACAHEAASSRTAVRTAVSAGVIRSAGSARAPRHGRTRAVADGRKAPLTGAAAAGDTTTGRPAHGRPARRAVVPAQPVAGRSVGSPVPNVVAVLRLRVGAVRVRARTGATTAVTGHAPRVVPKTLMSSAGLVRGTVPRRRTARRAIPESSRRFRRTSLVRNSTGRYGANCAP